MKALQINTCLYLAKGMAEYVNVLDIDEFFIPQGKHYNYADVLQTAENSGDAKNEGYSGDTDDNDDRDDRGNVDEGDDRDGRDGAEEASAAVVFADNQAHPACFFSIDSEVFMNRISDDRHHVWIGERYVEEHIHFVKVYCRSKQYAKISF